MFNCTCCGTEVNSPYFFEGGVYGYTCIKKVNPKAKRNKAKTNFFEVEVVKVVFDDMQTRGKAYVTINNCKQIVTAYRDWNGTNFEGLQIANFKSYSGKWYTEV